MNKFKTAAIYISLMVFSFSVYAAGEVEYIWLTVSNAMSGEPIEGVSITVDQAYIGETGPLGRILIPEGTPGQLIALYHTSYAAGIAALIAVRKGKGNIGHLGRTPSVWRLRNARLRLGCLFRGNGVDCQWFPCANALGSGNGAVSPLEPPRIFIQKEEQAAGGICAGLF